MVLNIKTRILQCKKLMNVGAVLTICLIGVVGCQQKNPESVIASYRSVDKTWHEIEDKVSEKSNNKDEYDSMMKAQAGEHPDVGPAVDASFKIASTSADNKKVFEALKFIIEETPGTSEAPQWMSRTLPYLQEKHLQKPEMMKLAYNIYRSYENDIDGYEDFMQALAQQNPDVSVQANVWYLLARTHYYFQNVPDVTQQEREVRKVNALNYLVKISDNPDYADVILYSRRNKKGKPPTPLLERVKSLTFAIHNLSIGSAIPDAKQNDLTGKPDKISNYKGKVLLVDFWATWCGPCVASIPELVEMKKEYGEGFEILSLSVDDALSDLTDFQEDTDMPWQHWYVSRKGKIVKDWNISAFPTYILVDQTGHIKLITSEMTESFKETIKETIKNSINQ